MPSENRYQRIRELFDKAVELSADQRQGFLEEACVDDGELLAEVTSLLDADADAGQFLDRPLGGDREPANQWIGKTVGKYRIVELLAVGGMGAVYLAEQEQPRRRVALKLIRATALSKQLVRRFELEAEVLGRLDHPGIAKIFEAATTDTGHGSQPYFAMEYIEGLPLTHYAREGELRTAERVILLKRVCEAVHHAHLNGVIHRDLKPGNILVREDGQPKVLDFGVARVTDADMQVTTMGTDLGQIIGTLAYMSPEQVRGHHEDLDLRSDVYSLGVLGYELITGKLPQKLSGKSISEAARIIEHVEPSSLGASGSSFPVDLETIIGKCLAKEKERRYSSAAEVAGDLERFLTHQPISARPPGVAYQLGKLARRNRALVAGAGLALCALLAGLVISIAGWNSAAQARTRAETEAEKAKLLSSYLTDVLQAPDPWLDGPEIKVVEILDRASESLESSLGGQPEVAALAHNRLGFTYYSLGQYDQAEPHLMRALEISDTTAGFPRRDHIEIHSDLSLLRLDQGNLDEAERMARDAFDDAAAVLDPDDPVRIATYQGLAIVHWEKGEMEEAEKLLRQCLEKSERVLGEENEDTMATVTALGNVLRQQKELEEAQPLLERAYAFNGREVGEDHPKSAIALNNLAFLYQERKLHDQALEMFQRSLESRRRTFGSESKSVVIGLNNLGLQLGIMGRGEEALPLLEEALGTAAAGAVDPAHWLGSAIRCTYGKTLLGLERYREAEKELLVSLEGMKTILGEEHWRTRGIYSHLVVIYQALGDPEREARFQEMMNAGQ